MTFGGVASSLAASSAICFAARRWRAEGTRLQLVLVALRATFALNFVAEKAATDVLIVHTSPTLDASTFCSAAALLVYC